MRAHEVATATPDETEALGARFGRVLTGPTLIGLVGELGAGKTCFVRGLGIDPDCVHSPSFTLVNEYTGGRLGLQHVDLYRLERPRDDDPLLREVLYADAVVAVEWYERLEIAAADDVLLVTFAFAAREGRVLRLEARGERQEEVLRRAMTAAT